MLLLASTRRLCLHSKAAKAACYSTTKAPQDRLVIAVGGNALQRRGERLTIENMLKVRSNIQLAELYAPSHHVVASLSPRPLLPWPPLLLTSLANIK